MRVNGNSVCVLVLAVLVAMVLWNAQRNMTAFGSATPLFPGGASSMISRFTSGRKVSLVGDDVHLSKETNAKIGAANKTKPKIKNPTLCTTEECKKITEEQRRKNDAKVRDTLKQCPTALIFIWAPWCPHCHNAMPTVVDAAVEADEEVVLVNSEAVSRDLISGDNAIAEVTHFPFLTKGGKTYEGRMDKASIANFCGKDADLAAANEPPPPPQEEAKDAFDKSEDLDSFFH